MLGDWIYKIISGYLCIRSQALFHEQPQKGGLHESIGGN
nr:MAG TPA: hypothetical protein [Caudoviricetes sp.]